MPSSARAKDPQPVGVDENAYLRASGQHPTLHPTGIADLSPDRPARLLDVLAGTVLAAWLAQRDQQWKAQISTASLDPFRGHATAMARRLPDTVRVLDLVDVVKVGLTCVDDVPARRADRRQPQRRGPNPK